MRIKVRYDKRKALNIPEMDESFIIGFKLSFVAKPS
ncbi:hypothetical protein AND4_02113 [Vibrio sp. AND4]|nr:hypothetical protein AND4_02113 [Vibrio sp. AND4]